MIAAYLGPNGSYSSMAAENIFPKGIRNPLNSFKNVFQAVETGIADYAVVPIENSIEGYVNSNLDFLVKSPLFIVGEYDFGIDNRVFTSKNVGKVTKLYSHPQAYNQCRENLERLYPEAEFYPTPSTKEAFRYLDGHSAVIAGAFNASDDVVMSPPVSDDKNNVTRFLVLSRDHKPLRTGDKISLLFEAENRPGGLVSILNVFERYGLDMTSIQSRPHKTALGRYLFYVDVLGSLKDSDSVKALGEVEKMTAFYKLLGNYKAADPETKNHGDEGVRQF